MKIKINSHIMVFVVAGFCLIFLPACRTLETSSDPHTLWSPPDSLHSETAPILTKQVDTSHPFTLAQCIDIALKNNPATRKAWQEARQAEAEFKQSRYRWYPDIDVSMNENWQKQTTHTETAGVTSRTVDEHSYYGPKAGITYLLLDMGGRSASIKKALEKLYQANFSFNQSIQDLLLEVEKAYYSFYIAGENVKISKTNVEETKQILHVIEKKFETGLVARLDVHIAKARCENELYNLAETEGAFKTAKAGLAKVLGLPADTEFDIARPSYDDLNDISREEVSTLIERGLKNRQDIAALRASVRAKEAALKKTKSDLWPRLNTELSAYDYDYHYYRAPPTKTRDDYGIAALLMVEWDIFDGFYNYYARRSAEKELAAEREKLRQAELEVSAQIWSKYYAYKTALSQCKHSEEFLHQVEKVYHMVVTAYKSGVADILDLIDLQKELSGARLKMTKATNNRLVSLAELIYEVGALNTEKKVNQKLH